MRRLCLLSLLVACSTGTRGGATTPAPAPGEIAEPVVVEEDPPPPPTTTIVEEEPPPPPPIVEEPPPPPAVAEAPPVEPRWKCPKKTKLVGEMGVEAWCEKKNGKRHGPYTRWDAEGRLEEDGQYRNGLREGRWAEFWEGQLAREGPYRRGKKHGVWIARGSGFESETTYQDGVEVDHIETVSDW